MSYEKCLEHGSGHILSYIILDDSKSEESTANYTYWMIQNDSKSESKL